MNDVEMGIAGLEESTADTAEEAMAQDAGFVLELSADWLILRASENVHRFLKEYHQRLVGEPLASFTLTQPLHDLRNSLSRQRTSTGIARAYRVRLIDEPRYFDFAFRLQGGRIVLEGCESADQAIGVWLGSVSRLIDGLPAPDSEGALEDAARRMRALTGFDRVHVVVNTPSGERRAESCRGNFAPQRGTFDAAALPGFIADTAAKPVRLYPHGGHYGALERALLRAPSAAQLEELRGRGVAAMMNVPLVRDGQVLGCFSCESRTPRRPIFELHAAAELLAQVLAMRMDGGR